MVGPVILAECRRLDTLTGIFILCSVNSPNLTCYITLWVHNINGRLQLLHLVLPLIFDMFPLNRLVTVGLGTLEFLCILKKFLELFQNSLNQKLVQCFYKFFVWDNFRLGEKCSANFVYFFLNELKISPTGS